MITNKQEYLEGIRDGIPIALGYFAVSFTFGMMAVTGGLGIFQAVFTSVTNVTSAGQFAALAIIISDGSFLEMILTTLIINLRYSLMSFAVSQKIEDKGHIWHRFLVAFGMTDEIFGISINHHSKINPFYNYGAMSVAIPGWCLGTLAGAISGNVLPAMLISALSVAIYGMFLAIIIPPAEKNPTLYWVIGGAMLGSAAFAYLPYLKNLTSGFVIIIITVVVSAVAAVVRPIPDPKEEEM
jgi:predicted branched-subunit amino acid permease